MASVAFHTGVTDVVDHALRLTRKALSTGARVLVIGPVAFLQELDERLWTNEPGSFLPHATVQADRLGATEVVRAPVWLMPLGAQEQAVPLPPEPGVLLNVGAAVPDNAQAFAKVIEVVGSDPQARAQGQQRWRAWRERGVDPAHHKFA